MATAKNSICRQEKTRDILRVSRRVVVKVGSSTLTRENGRTHLQRMDRLALALAEVMNQGREVVLVTSGAIAAGMGKLGLEKRPSAIVFCLQSHGRSSAPDPYGHGR